MDFISTPIETTPESVKKRKRRPEKWKCNVRKKLIYSAKGGPGPIKCTHRKHWECSVLTDDDTRQFHAAFYALPIKEKQDAFILKYVSAIPTKRPRKQDPVLNRGPTLKYRIASTDGKEHLVCRDTFLSVLQLKKHRVLGVFQRFKRGKTVVPVERRGGSRKVKLFAQKLEAVIAFIKQLKGVVSHYARKNSKKIYLPSDLNIAKLHKMYLNSVGDQDHLKVKETYFRRVFNTKFNLGFGSPSSDECSISSEDLKKDYTNWNMMPDSHVVDVAGTRIMSTEKNVNNYDPSQEIKQELLSDVEFEELEVGNYVKVESLSDSENRLQDNIINHGVF